MATTININVLDVRSLDQAQIDLETYIADLEEKAKTLCNRLATIGAIRASLDFSRAIYNGKNDVDMFEMADEAYAVSNAVEELMLIATDVIGSNNEDAVAKWLLEFAEIEA